MDTPRAAEITDKTLVLDYLGFGLIVLPRQAKALLMEYERATDDRAKRALAVALVSTWMQQYEQLGAWVLACKNRAITGKAIFDSIRSYGIGDADLELVAKDFVSVDRMAAQLGFDVRNVTSVFSQAEVHTRLVDVWEGLQASTKLQTDYKTFYNKSKHGMAVLYDSGTGNGPCAISFDGTELSCLQCSDEQARDAAYQVCRLADATADLLTLFLLSDDPGLQGEIESVAGLAPGAPLTDWLDRR